MIQLFASKWYEVKIWPLWGIFFPNLPQGLGKDGDVELLSCL